MSEKPRIISAAIALGRLIVSMPAPKRHADVFTYAIRTGLDNDLVRRGHKGFLTSDGRFVRRPEAALIAFEAGQTETNKGVLTTEHVW